MQMGTIEKLFVNSDSHSRQVSQHAENLLKRVSFTPNQTYLDVGCGNGAAPIHIARKFGLEVTGIDVDPAQIQIAQANSRDLDNVRFLTIDGTELPFANGQFDLVFTNKVTHHIPNWPEALAEMSRVLKPNGYLLYADLVVPNWVAAVGQVVAGNQLGFPTRQALSRLVAANRLTEIHRAASLFHYEAIFQNSAG